ncbi:MAG TPA: hypothetical protein VFX17_01650 [Patescibacteria group bacterium]|nr:hypothetical protein [Patescibacteria group bacterium]
MVLLDQSANNLNTYGKCTFAGIHPGEYKISVGDGARGDVAEGSAIVGTLIWVNGTQLTNTSMGDIGDQYAHFHLNNDGTIAP